MRSISFPQRRAVDVPDPIIDDIGTNIFSVHNDTQDAAEELTTAHRYQRKAGRRMACLMIVVAIVGAVVLLAVSPIVLHLLRTLLSSPHADSIMIPLFPDSRTNYS